MKIKINNLYANPSLVIDVEFFFLHYFQVGLSCCRCCCCKKFLQIQTLIDNFGYCLQENVGVCLSVHVKYKLHFFKVKAKQCFECFFF